MGTKERTFRFQDKDFDLDLSYITDRILVFSSPVDSVNKSFKNSSDQIARLHIIFFVFFLIELTDYSQSYIPGVQRYSICKTCFASSHYIAPLRSNTTKANLKKVLQ